MLALAGARPPRVALAERPSTTAEPDTSAEVALAGALVDDLNRGDEDGVVALFADEATLRADRYAWARYEIRLWAHAQIAASIAVEPEGPIQTVPNRGLWTARVQRADWREAGVAWVRLANQIVTEADHIVDFASDPIDSTSVAPLGNLWQPGSTPSRLPPLAHTGASRVPSAGDRSASTPATLVVPGVLAGVIVCGCARLVRPRTRHRRRPSSLVADLGQWQRSRGAAADGRLRSTCWPLG